MIKRKPKDFIIKIFDIEFKSKLEELKKKHEKEKKK